MNMRILWGSSDTEKDSLRVHCCLGEELAPVQFRAANPSRYKKIQFINKSEREGRIIGGRNANPGEFPWQLSFQLYGMHFCGAVIYDELNAITTAHCCVREGIYNNVNRLSVANTKVTISGWGDTGEYGQGSPILKKLTVPLLGYEACNRMYKGKIKHGMICAGQLHGGVDTCQVGWSCSALNMLSQVGPKLLAFILVFYSCLGWTNGDGESTNADWDCVMGNGMCSTQQSRNIHGCGKVYELDKKDSAGSQIITFQSTREVSLPMIFQFIKLLEQISPIGFGDRNHFFTTGDGVDILCKLKKLWKPFLHSTLKMTCREEKEE
ncbi:unnamed protein product, partial [Darwinula stevensoni]